MSPTPSAPRPRLVAALWVGLIVGAVLMVSLPVLWGTRFTARGAALLLPPSCCPGRPPG